jgi:hypothetical protein
MGPDLGVKQTPLWIATGWFDIFQGHPQKPRFKIVKDSQNEIARPD